VSTLNAFNVAAIARGAGLPSSAIPTAVAIAKAESGFVVEATGDVALQDNKWGPSIGLWQIRSLRADYGTGRTRDGSKLELPGFNARSMVKISNGGTDWSAWSTYNSGAYKKHLAEAQRAAADIGPAPKGGGYGGGQGSTKATPTDFELPGPDVMYGLGGLLGEKFLNKAGDAAGGVVDDTVDKIRAVVLVGLVWTAALGLGVSLVLVGSWRMTQGD
jgi:hypothetical protein